MWQNLIDRNFPYCDKKKNIIEITTRHELRGFGYYIFKYIIFDERFKIISDKSFNVSKDSPVSRHDINEFKNIIFAICLNNKHDN